jgi:alkanesulfonate monooxygenase SsuD/methylene tetrahydromethanopterin reductase-like flavin-dependent oxidoreductase (luciferase family)
MSHPSLGVIFLPNFPPETLGDYARQAESAGFDELWLWDDCFQPGALASAAIALSSTSRLRVGIGLMPATVYNPLFAAMEITTLARAFPGRFLPGFGHGVGSWMAQIGAAPKSSLQALEETVTAVRRLLGGELVTTHGGHVNLDQVQMQLTPGQIPPLYIGAMRPKTFQLAGRVGDGTILPGFSSPGYVRWAWEHIRTGMSQSGRLHHHMVVYLAVKVGRDGKAARAAMRRNLGAGLLDVEPQLTPLEMVDEVAAFVKKHGVEGAGAAMPDEWVDTFSAAGTPEQVEAILQPWMTADVDSLVFEPIDHDPACLDEYARYLMPRLTTRQPRVVESHEERG